MHMSYHIADKTFYSCKTIGIRAFDLLNIHWIAVGLDENEITITYCINENLNCPLMKRRYLDNGKNI